MKLKRFKNNPIIAPRGDDWEACATFNPAAIYKDGKIHLLYRAVGDYLKYAANLGYAIFDENLNLIKRFDKPILKPDIKVWEFSIENPRICEIEGELFLTYVVTPTPFCPGPVRIRLGIPKPAQSLAYTALAKGNDFFNFTRQGVITPFGVGERDTMFFPEKINGNYAVIHRPSNWIGSDYYGIKAPGIWFAYYNDEHKYLYNHKFTMASKRDWESKKIGAGAPPIRTEAGWLLLYHGVDKDSVYRAGAVLLDLKEPWKVIACTPEPILEPEEDYEMVGDVPNVVFPEGNFIIGDELIVIYGAADKVCCAAKVELDEFINYLLDLGHNK